ncbi:MAG: glycosyltransferase [Bacteroidetes bacterium]|nr:glycosyltransferase [Bacteroidota bacterium]
MMRVLHLNANSAGGAFMAAQRLHEAFQQRQDILSHHLVFSGAPGNYDLWAQNRIKRYWATALHAFEKLDFLRYEKDKSVRFAFSHGRSGIDILSHPLYRNADVVHLHWINKGFISLDGLENMLQSGKKIVWTCHDLWPFTGGCYHPRDCDGFTHGCGNCPYLKKPEMDDLSSQVFLQKQQMYAQARQFQFVAPSQWLSDTAGRSAVMPHVSPVVIPNGIDTRQFAPANRMELRKKYNISEDENVLLFAAANLSNPYKGFAQLNEVLDALKALNLQKVRIVLIGENKSGVTFSNAWPVQSTGYISKPELMAEWYGLADMYVTTSLEENLPTTIMESMACGTPVAAFQVGGIPEMVEDGETGVLAPLKSSDELANKIAAWLQSAQEIQNQKREVCRESALNAWDSRKVAQRYFELYAGNH